MATKAKPATKKRAPSWKDGTTISLEIRPDLFTVALMKRSPYLQFYALSSSDGKWGSLNLNNELRLFCVPVVRASLQELSARKLSEKQVVTDERPFPPLWLRSRTWIGEGYPFRGADLIRLDPNVGSGRAEVVEHDIDFSKNLKLVRNLEIVNVYGTGNLRNRLIGFFDEGIDRPLLKSEVFRVDGSVVERTRADIEQWQAE